MMKRILPAFAGLVLIAGCNEARQAPEAKVSEAWIRLPATPGGAAAGYFVAQSNQDGDSVVAVSSPGLRIEMHESMTMNHMSGMRAIAAAPFDDGRVAFAPGGKHLMIFGLAPARAPGGTLPLAVTFAKAPPVRVSARLVGAGDPAPADGR